MTPEPAADTRERILDSAEQLFAARGYGSTSLRSITTDAKVNLAAINYHFKSKEGLLKEVLHRRIDPVNSERLAMLDRLEAENDYSPPRILRALLEPALRLKERFGARGEAVVTIVGRLHADPPAIAGDLFRELFQEMFLRFSKAFRKALPDLPESELALRLHYTIGSMIHIMQCGNHLKSFTHELPADVNSSGLLDSVIAFTAAGLTAPPPSQNPGGNGEEPE